MTRHDENPRHHRDRPIGPSRPAVEALDGRKWQDLNRAEIAVLPLRVYDPKECDERGVPLDWERCRTCHDGVGLEPGYSTIGVAGYLRHGSRTSDWGADVPCPTCGGHGSLKIAVLGHLKRGQWVAQAGIGSEAWVRRFNMVEAAPPDFLARCECCGHPMVEGTWDNPGAPDGDPLLDEISIDSLLHKPLNSFHEWAFRHGGAHYSACDERCAHHGPGRATGGQLRDELVGRWLQKANQYGITPTPTFEALWRSVDARLLGWEHDLRPERLALLCLRCWTERQA